MTILFNSDLSCRDFASHLLYVPDLLEWVKAKRLHLRTTPPIESYEFVQVENLLCAIERKAGDLTIEQAHEIVANDPVLKNERAADDPTSARWLLGATAHRKWRELLSGAIQNQELSLLDFGSKLPIQTAPEQSPATPEPEEAVGASDGVELAKPAQAKPLQRTAAQDAAILCEIEKQGFDPLALPKNPDGKPGAKAAIRTALRKNPLFAGSTVFDKAWERLTASDDIVIQG